jgi:hypothetical protein
MIDILSKEDFWIYGKIRLNKNGQNYEDFFSAIVCEEGFDETELTEQSEGCFLPVRARRWE